MPSSYTPLLRFELPVQGELSGTWGNVVNTAITTPVSEAIAGTTSISVGATDYTLTNGDGATSNEARKMFITATGSPGAARNVICPATSKLYVFRNDTSGGFAMTLKTSAGSGVAVPAGQSRLLYCDGTNVVDAVNGFGSLTLSTALAATSGGTGQSSYAVGDLLYASTTTALSKLAAVATGNVLRSGGVGTAPAWGPVALATDVSGTLPIANGGTGAATLAANNVLLGNGTSAVQTVAPGTAGNVLTSAGGTWTSAVLPASYVGPNIQIFTGNGAFNVPSGITKVKATVVGGGGLGGNFTSGGSGEGAAGGGGGGAVAVKWVTVTSGGSYSVTVGGSGENSVFDSITSACGATGGTGSIGVFAAGGAGGAVTDTSSWPGFASSGSAGVAGGSNGSVGVGGAGGISGAASFGDQFKWGNGAASNTSGTGATAGSAGSTYGGGGSGAARGIGSGGASGGAGAQGVVIIEW